LSLLESKRNKTETVAFVIAAGSGRTKGPCSGGCASPNSAEDPCRALQGEEDFETKRIIQFFLLIFIFNPQCKLDRESHGFELSGFLRAVYKPKQKQGGCPTPATGASPLQLH